MSNSSLVNVHINAYQGNYSGQSSRKKIKEITIHHMAGVLTAKECGYVFARAGRGGSAHYGVGTDGLIGQYVPENCVAWHCGNWEHNQQSVGIELANSSTGGEWYASDKTLDLTARLVADIAKRNGLGKLKVGHNLTYHSMYQATTCPGNYVRSKMQYIADQANGIIGRGETMPTIDGAFDRSYCDGFLPAPDGYWDMGDRNERIAVLASWMRKNFPSYTPEAALGNYYGQNIASAIKEFQKRAKLAGVYNDEADGKTGPKTYAALKHYGFPYGADEPKPAPEPQKPAEQPKPAEKPNEPTPKPEEPQKPKDEPTEQVPVTPPVDSGMTQKQWDKYVANGMQTVKLFERAGKKFNWRLNMSDKVYDALKKIALFLPAVSFIYVGLAEIWGFGFGEQVDATIQLAITAINTLLGMAVMKASSDYKKKQ